MNKAIFIVSELSPVARAFELAREGKCRTIEDIRRSLLEEHFTAVNSHLDSGSLRNQLRKLMASKDP